MLIAEPEDAVASLAAVTDAARSSPWVGAAALVDREGTGARFVTGASSVALGAVRS